MVGMKRREFLSVLGGAAAMQSRVARAQQVEGMRRIGIIVPASSTDRKFQIQVQAFEQELKKFGWMIGQNVQIETRWATANDGEIRKNAAELVALKPDVVLAHGGSTVGPMQQATRTIPIVFLSPVTRWPLDWLKAWRGQEATSLVLRCSNIASARSGSNCSKKLHPA